MAPNILNETFDTNPGYDDADWVESGTGGTINEDFAAPAVTGFSGECLRTYISGAWKGAKATNNIADSATIYFRTYLYINSENMADTKYRNIIRFNSAGNQRIDILKTGSDLQLTFYTNGTLRDTETILVQTSYLLEVYLNNTGTTDSWEWKIDGVSKGSGSGSANLSGDSDSIVLGIITELADNHTIDIYWDNVAVDTTGWIGGVSTQQNYTYSSPGQLTAPTGAIQRGLVSGRTKDGGESFSGVPTRASILGGRVYTGISSYAGDESRRLEAWRILDNDDSVSSYYPVDADCLLYRAYWDGTPDDHSNGGTNDGTVVGGTFIEKGIDFDGTDDRVTMSVAGGTVHSVFVYVKIDDFDYNHPVIAGGDDGTYQCVFRIMYSGNRLYYQTSSTNNAYVDDGAVTPGTWYQYAVVRNGTSVNFYKNGSPKGDTQTLTDNDNFTLKATGAYDDGGAEMDGMVGEILFFNTAKSADDVSNYYNATKARYGL